MGGKPDGTIVVFVNTEQAMVIQPHDVHAHKRIGIGVIEVQPFDGTYPDIFVVVLINRVNDVGTDRGGIVGAVFVGSDAAGRRIVYIEASGKSTDPYVPFTVFDQRVDVVIRQLLL